MQLDLHDLAGAKPERPHQGPAPGQVRPHGDPIALPDDGGAATARGDRRGLHDTDPFQVEPVQLIGGAVRTGRQRQALRYSCNRLDRLHRLQPLARPAAPDSDRSSSHGGQGGHRGDRSQQRRQVGGRVLLLPRLVRFVLLSAAMTVTPNARDDFSSSGDTRPLLIFSHRAP